MILRCYSELKRKFSTFFPESLFSYSHLICHKCFYDENNRANADKGEGFSFIPTGSEPAASEINITELEHLTFDLVKKQRELHDIDPLTWDEEVAKVARAHSADMAENVFYAHKNLNCEGPGDRLEKAGFVYIRCAENIHQIHGMKNAGRSLLPKNLQELAAKAVEDWMNSAGHRKNILDCALKSSGIGGAVKQLKLLSYSPYSP